MLIKLVIKHYIKNTSLYNFYYTMFAICTVIDILTLLLFTSVFLFTNCNAQRMVRAFE